MYLHKFVLNADIAAFLDEFKTNGDYENYEIVSASLYGGSVLFIFKEKAGA